MALQDEINPWLERISALGDALSGDSAVEWTEVIVLANEARQAALPGPALAGVLFSCSSVVLNVGMDRDDRAALERGGELALEARGLTEPGEPLWFQCEYNVANSGLALSDAGLPRTGSRLEWEPALIADRIAQSERLKALRATFFHLGHSPEADLWTRSSALCNLGNMLDHSGRWAEAYDYYLASLEAHPKNGNAAGNLALLLASRLEAGLGQRGHLGAVHDKYVRLARELRAGTVEFASQKVAERWDELEEMGSQGHLAHGLESSGHDAEYRKWVATYRLALSPAVEGLGTEEARWDTSTVETLYGAGEQDMNPPLLAAMNVLKSDFLVSRRLAYEGSAQMFTGLNQAADDPGAYIETFDFSLYGTQYSKLLLAQRSALDVLDKTAVVANEHFAVGDDPSRVSFRRFWSEGAAGLREGVLPPVGRRRPVLALWELALDMGREGMYAASQAMRNAGTHRVVHASTVGATGVTQESRSSILEEDLLSSTILALQVTRSAYLYLIDLVAAWNHPEDHPGHHVLFESVRYVHDLIGSPSEGSGNDTGHH